MALCLSGGCLLQFAGCASGIVPVLLTFAESGALSLLFGNLFL